MSVNGNDQKNFGKNYARNADSIPDVEKFTVTIGKDVLNKSTAGVTGYTLSSVVNSIQTIRTLGGILYHQAAPDVKKFSLTFISGSPAHDVINKLLSRRISNTANMFDIAVLDGLGRLHTFKDCLLDSISDVTGSIDSFGEYTANFIAKDYTVSDVK